MLTKKEKIKKVIELLKERVPIREIAKEVNMSNTTICLIKRQIDLLSNNDKKENPITNLSETQSTKDDSSMTVAAVPINKDVSKHSQGLKLLLGKKSLVEISILLDLETDETLKIYNDFLILQKTEEVSAFLIENKNNLDVLINIQSYLLSSKN